MSYSGESKAREARESLGKALAALQEDPNIPEDVMAVAQNIAKSVGALFEAERASSEVDGKASVRSALGSLSQTLALLQDVRSRHRGIELATEVIAKAMSLLYPLTTVPSRVPTPSPAARAQSSQAIPAPGALPTAPGPGFTPPAPIQSPQPVQQVSPFGPPSAPSPLAQTAPLPAEPMPARPSQPRPSQPQPPGNPFAPQPAPPAPAAAASPYRGGPRQPVEVNVGATTESNFYVGFSGEVAEGGVFLSTYEVFDKGTPIDLLVTLPGGFEFKAMGAVRFVRDPMDLSSDSEPGMGIQFEGLGPDARELVLRFIRKRAPMFYDD